MTAPPIIPKPIGRERIPIPSGLSPVFDREEMKEKVVVLRELDRAIIYNK
jgi:hypothetical protein